MDNLLDWRDHTGSEPEKFYKKQFWQGEYLMIGINCLEPNQTQKAHIHSDVEKVYFVLEGRGRFTLGDEETEVDAGALVVAAAGVVHGVTNVGDGRLSLLVAMAPVK